MEVLEPVSPYLSHMDQDDACPFCPAEPPPTFTTHPGSANDSGRLECIMVAPPDLVPQQPGARPKTGGNAEQAESTPQAKPNPIYTDAVEGPYSCEAHHLISGKQALEGHVFERWIVAGNMIEKDTGYSVNNADNGLWAPSIPEKYKDGKWGPKSFADKLAIACKPMAAGKPQFHKGHHAIRDPDDPDQIKHQKYDDYLKGMLKTMDDRMQGWSKRCPRCGQGSNPKFQPSVRVNQALDNLSSAMRTKISAPATMWDVFISRYALEFHKPICPHHMTTI